MLPHRLKSLWFTVRDSLWFLPTIMVCVSVALAIELVALEGAFAWDLPERWPRLFGAGADGSRGVLSAIATSMITVTGVVFSITVVTLSLASSQYSPRVLRNFMADRLTQFVLGAFVSIYAYCLIVLRTIRGGDENTFVPSLAVLGGVLLAFLGVAMLIYYIHHVASAIRASSIVTRITVDTADAIDRLFPSRIGEEAGEDAQAPGPGDTLPDHWAAVAARSTGYLVGVDGDKLLALACEYDTVLRVSAHVGDFVIEGEPALHVAGTVPPTKQARSALLDCLALQSERTVHQDAAYGLQQLVDVALKALSPGINDPTTAVVCIDQLGALMVRMAERHVEGPYRSVDGTLRLIAEGPDYSDLLTLAFDAIGDQAAPHAAVYRRLILTLDRIGAATLQLERRAVLAARMRALMHQMQHARLAPQRLAALASEADTVLRRLER